MMEDELRIKVFKTPPYKSEINGQIERFHSTLSEIMRCLKTDGISRSFKELLERATNEYNHTVHSTTKRRPVELYFGRCSRITPEEFEKSRLDNIEKLKQKQYKDREYHNKRRKPAREYKIGETIFVKHNKRIGSKLTVRYVEEKVKENRNSTVITESGRIVHKSNIRN